MASQNQKGLLIENLPYAFSYHQIVTDENDNPVDSVFLHVNRTFEETTGLSRDDLVGKKLTQVQPYIKDDDFDWINLMERVALKGEKVSFEKYVERINGWYEVSAYQVKPGYFAVIFSDITSRKETEEQVAEKNEILASLNNIAIEQAKAHSYTELTELILKQLRENTGALMCAFSEYDAEGKTLITRKVKSDHKIIDFVVRIGGRKILNTVTFVDDDFYQEITSSIIGYRETFTAASRGAVPPEVSAAIQKMTGIRILIGLAHMVEGQLYGVSLLGFRENQPRPSREFLESFAYISAISLRRKQAEEEIRYLSFHDSLTGLYNRNFLEKEMKRMDTDRQQPISIIMADLNGLKLVNDSYGHSKGDEMLKITAEVLKKSCRQEDILARWGGDEFVIFLPQTSEKEALAICKRITKNYKKITVNGIPISMALGIAVKEASEEEMSEVFKEAEDNMYKNKLTESRSTRSAVLNALLKTLEEKSYETSAHTRTMQDVALKISERLDLPESEQKKLSLLITLHDIGKINISEEILTKEGPLSEEEWELIKKHPETGHRITCSTEEFAHVAEEILAHHERWDGSGYPQGLKGKEIPLLARITAIVDAYEVMSNGRPYKKAMSREEIIAEFRRCAGSQFDPELVKLFLSMLEKEEQ